MHNKASDRKLQIANLRYIGILQRLCVKSQFCICAKRNENINKFEDRYQQNNIIFCSYSLHSIEINL